MKDRYHWGDLNPSDRVHALTRIRVYRAALIMFLLGIAGSCWAALWLWQEANRVDAARFGSAVTNLIERLDAGTERYAMELERFTDYIGAQPEISEEIWREAVTRIAPQSNFPAFQELAFASNTKLQTAEVVMGKTRPDPKAPGMLTLPSAILGLVRSLRMTEHGFAPLVISHDWLSPEVDLLTQTEKWVNEPQVQDCWRATRTGRMIASTRRHLPKAGGGYVSAVSLFLPVVTLDFLELSKHFTDSYMAQLRENRLRGIVVGTIGWEQFLKTALPRAGNEVGFEAFGEGGMTTNTWMGNPAGSPQVLDQAFKPRFRQTHNWPFYRQRWQLVFFSTPTFEKQSVRYRAWAALSGGLVCSGLIAGILALQGHAQWKQEGISRQLRVAIKELEKERKVREGLSHDLHDGAIQSLYALQLGLSRTGEQVEAFEPTLGKRIADYTKNVTSVIVELRGFILRHEYAPEEEGSLINALTALVERVRGSTDMTITCDLSNDAAGCINGEQAVHLANFAREALSNALRHSAARNIKIILEREGPWIKLEVSDDGIGFDPKSTAQTGLGLRSMAARCREVGGELRILPRPGGGSSVSALARISNNQTPKTIEQ